MLHKNNNIIINLAKLGDTNLVNYCIKNGYNVNAKSTNGNNALHNAVRKLDIDMVKLLTNNGIEINSKNKGGMTPLFHLLFMNNVPKNKYPLFKKIIKHLISKGASLTNKDQKLNEHDCFFSLIEEHVKTFNDVSYFDHNNIKEFDKTVGFYSEFLKQIGIPLDKFVHYNGYTSNNLTRLSVVDKENIDLDTVDENIIWLSYSDFLSNENPIELLSLLESIDNKKEIKNKIDFDKSNLNSMFIFCDFLKNKLLEIDKNSSFDQETKNKLVHTLFSLYGKNFKRNIERGLSFNNKDLENQNKHKEISISLDVLKICCLTTKNSTINLLGNSNKIFSLALEEIEKRQEFNISYLKKDQIKEVKEIKKDVPMCMDKHDHIMLSLLKSKTTHSQFKL